MPILLGELPYRCRRREERPAGPKLAMTAAEKRRLRAQALGQRLMDRLHPVPWKAPQRDPEQARLRLQIRLRHNPRWLQDKLWSIKLRKRLQRVAWRMRPKRKR